MKKQTKNEKEVSGLSITIFKLEGTLSNLTDTISGLGNRVSGLALAMEKGFAAVDKRFVSIDERFAAMRADHEDLAAMVTRGFVETQQTLRGEMEEMEERLSSRITRVEDAVRQGGVSQELS